MKNVTEGSPWQGNERTKRASVTARYGCRRATKIARGLVNYSSFLAKSRRGEGHHVLLVQLANAAVGVGHEIREQTRAPHELAHLRCSAVTKLAQQHHAIVRMNLEPRRHLGRLHIELLCDQLDRGGAGADAG